MAFEVTPELLLRFLELIVLTLTAMVISLQLASSFYRNLDDEANSEVEDYMPFEMSYVAFFMIFLCSLFILLYLFVLAYESLGMSLSLIAIVTILIFFSVGFLLYTVLLAIIGQDMAETVFSRD